MRITTPEGTIPAGREAEAAAKLCRLEDFADTILREYTAAADQLSAFRAQDKTKTARFRELLGEKLLLSQILVRLKQARLLEKT